MGNARGFLRRKQSGTKKAKVIFHYYQDVFKFFHYEYHEDFRYWLHEMPVKVQKQYWENNSFPGVYKEQLAWDALNSYLSFIEKSIENIVNKHSVYFWIHFYRRIGVQLSGGHYSKNDAPTLAFVRKTWN